MVSGRIRQYLSFPTKNIINGYLDDTFKPEANITRAEFAKIIVAATNSYDYEVKCSLTDVSNKIETLGFAERFYFKIILTSPEERSSISPFG